MTARTTLPADDVRSAPRALGAAAGQGAGERQLDPPGAWKETARRFDADGPAASWRRSPPSAAGTG
ncbi:hypothetical protein ACWZEH_21530 [Streptomyces sp. QTS137]